MYPAFVKRDTIHGDIGDGRGSIVVSTINRQSSAMLSHGDWYAETIVFSLKDDGSLNEILDQSESCVNSLVGHNRMVEKWTNNLKGETHE